MKPGEIVAVLLFTVKTATRQLCFNEENFLVVVKRNGMPVVSPVIPLVKEGPEKW